MVLRLELAPLEKVIIGNCHITNGPKRTQFTIERSGPVLRSKFIIDEDRVSTPCEQLYVALQRLYLAPGVDEASAAYKALSACGASTITALPEFRVEIENILMMVSPRPGGMRFQALKDARYLLEREFSKTEGDR